MKFFLQLLIIAFCFGVAVQASDGKEVELVPLTDFKGDAALAKKKNVPLLLAFMQEHCPFCRLVEDDFLRPMLISGDYEDKVIIRTVELDGYTLLDNLQGKSINARDLANSYTVSVTPTLIFLDANGNELTKRMIGITTVYYYGGYLDEAIDKALEKLSSLSESVEPQQHGGD